MSREIGIRLRRARESLGLSLADVSRRTNIQIKYIIAIEKGEWDRLPNIIYARAYVKTYAKLVGEDVHFTQMARRGPVNETMYSTQTRRHLTYTQSRQNTRRLRQIQSEVIDKTDSKPEEDRPETAVENQQSPGGSVSVEESEERTFPSRREKENQRRRKKEGSSDPFFKWYDRILIVSGILLIIGFGIFFIIKWMSPPGLSIA